MIEGRRINLRAREDEDAQAFHRWFNDPEITRFLGNPFPALSMTEQRAFIEQLRDGSGRRAYSIVLKDGTLIGNCEMREFNWPARSCEVGIVIGEKQCWGQGYGGEALELMLMIAFDALNLHKVWLTCAAYNERGLRAYRRVGFQEDGRLRDDRFIDGRYADTIVMSVLEDEWHAKSATVIQQPEQMPEQTEQTLEQAQQAEQEEQPEQEELEWPGFRLILQRTYYERGFFNVPVDADRYARQEEGPIELVTGDDEQVIAGRLDRKTNPNGTARIFGGAKLRKWFMTNFQQMDQIEVDLSSPDIIRLRPIDDQDAADPE